MHSLTPDQIAVFAKLTPQRVARIMREFRKKMRTNWHGAELLVVETPDGPEVAFHSLPDFIREAVVMQDQPELPLTPPQRNTINLTVRKEIQNG